MKPLAQQSLYEILEVPVDATSAVVAEALERAQALYAPGSLATYTLMPPEEEQLLFRRLEEARATLLDPAARARYDERLAGGALATPDLQDGPQHEQAMDAALRMAWPELPPVIPAIRPLPAEGEWEGDDDVDAPAGDVASARHAAARESTRPSAAPAPPPVIPTATAEVAPARAPEAASPSPAETPPSASPAPILLSREVAPSAAAPAAPGPVATPVPMVPPPAAPAPVQVPDGTAWTGEVLRRIREARGLSVQQISERTKVTRHHIDNIEADRFEQLPAPVYLRGILLSIARELRLDGQKVARSYLERASAAASSTTPFPRLR